MSLWPQFRSALVWDVFAVSTYFTVSLLFWYMGMIPDLATLRDRATGRLAQIVYGMLALGWRNSARHWQRFEMAYLLLGGLATPLVISVHSVVSSDFAISIVPAWHETVFPPYFVAGAIFSGFAMVILLCVPIRHFYHLKEFITIDHLDVMGKLVLATSLLTSYGYLSEQSLSWYAHDTVEWYTYWFRLTGFGQYAVITWTLFFCNTIVPQILWIRPLAAQGIGVGDRVAAGAGGHVAGTLHDHHHQPEPRLPAVVVGLLQADDLGHCHLLRVRSACSWLRSCCSPAFCPSSRCRRRGPCCPARTGRRWDDEAEDADLRPDGGIPDGRRRSSPPRVAPGRPAIARWTPTRPIRSRVWRPSWACARPAFPLSC